MRESTARSAGRWPENRKRRKDNDMFCNSCNNGIWIIILIILLFGWGGNGFGCGCGCESNNNCGCGCGCN
jgi:hypothetical protein